MIVSFCTHQERRLIVMSTRCVSKKLVGNHDNHRHGNNLGTILLTLRHFPPFLSGPVLFLPKTERSDGSFPEQRLVIKPAHFRVAVGLLIKARQVHDHPRNLVPRFSLLPVAIHVKERLKNLCVNSSSGKLRET